MDIDEALSADIMTQWLNPEILQKSQVDTYRSQFKNSQPFNHLYIDNLIRVDKLEQVADELAEQEFEFKESDLFQFAQTVDFDEIGSELLYSFKDLFRSTPFLTMMTHITGVPLSDDVDSLGNIYTDTDYLLCHDDKLIKRKIAYILYLTDLDETEGGGLKLYDTDEGQPGSIVKSISPRYNRFMFFHVTRSSFHEVEEVIGTDVYRVTISGWFNNKEDST